MASDTTVAGTLPWASTRSDQRRFLIVLAVLLLLAGVPAALIPTVQLPPLPTAAPEDTSSHLARLVQPPRAAEPEPPPPGESPPESRQERPQRPVRAQPVTPRPGPQVAQPQSVEQARQVASQSGILAMREQLAQLRAAVPTEQGRLSANLAADRVTGSADGTRDTEAALSGSGGVEDRTAPTQEIALATHEVAQVAAPEAEVRPAPATPAPAASQRAMSNIRQVFESQKTALYSLYRRELRQDPTLAGKVLLELVIEPDGRVSHCEVVSSELGNPALEQRLANRVLLFDFGARDVEARTVRFPIDFLPS
ncbi:MAG: AgmX/PglI C-terminal domain-containing protein [Marinobacter sp.]|uniref:AgmX/PglI C-terminal domain-containing protein n=1 Tax=Marinobacter sp. TaxID=50741 RepID=UPI00299DFFB0|nr:AgmX/PglI C-terminal domain-containing protein [Marinobacter sp.]MDX1754918.1 AgmX/PglI C-terminal domain-containing protein [Marinobacter sp.]